MLRSGKQRNINDTTLSDRELRKVEADGVVLEQKLETLREQQEEREEDLKEPTMNRSPIERRTRSL